jgi:hypothetical protein
VVALLAVVVLVGWSILRRDPIGPSSYYRIRQGMTRAGVETIIGLPPGDYSNREEMYENELRKFNRMGSPEKGKKPAFKFAAEVLGWGYGSDSGLPIVNFDAFTFESWVGDKYGLNVCFDQQGAVVGCALGAGCTDEHPSWLWTLSVYIDTRMNRLAFGGW